jgi:hypothetical protein
MWAFNRFQYAIAWSTLQRRLLTGTDRGIDTIPPGGVTARISPHGSQEKS